MGAWFSRRDFLPAGLKADQVELDGNRIRVHARSLDASAACPRCGMVSRHVHSKYWRRPADLPAHGREVELVLLVRRFRCPAVGCPTKIFSERFTSTVAVCNYCCMALVVARQQQGRWTRARSGLIDEGVWKAAPSARAVRCYRLSWLLPINRSSRRNRLTTATILYHRNKPCVANCNRLVAQR